MESKTTVTLSHRELVDLRVALDLFIEVSEEGGSDVTALRALNRKLDRAGVRAAR